MSINKDSGSDSDYIVNEVRLVKEQQARFKSIDGHSYSMYPYNCIGLIIGYHQGKQLHGTGTLLSSHIVLTSAHNVLGINKNRLRRIKPEHLFFYTQICGQLEPSKKVMVLDYRICTQYEQRIPIELELVKEKEKIKSAGTLDKQQKQKLQTIREKLKRLRKDIADYDYCLLKLEKGVRLDEYLPLTVLKQIISKGNAPTVDLCGYINSKTKYHQYQSTNRREAKIQITNNCGFYNLDTQQGQSGAPVFISQADKQIIGIHKGYQKKPNLNFCTLISQQMLKDLQVWMKEFFQFKLTETEAVKKQMDSVSICKLKQKLQQAYEKIDTLQEKILQLTKQNSELLKKCSSKQNQKSQQAYREYQQPNTQNIGSNIRQILEYEQSFNTLRSTIKEKLPTKCQTLSSIISIEFDNISSLEEEEENKTIMFNKLKYPYVTKKHIEQQIIIPVATLNKVCQEQQETDPYYAQVTVFNITSIFTFKDRLFAQLASRQFLNGISTESKFLLTLSYKHLKASTPSQIAHFFIRFLSLLDLDVWINRQHYNYIGVLITDCQYADYQMDIFNSAIQYIKNGPCGTIQNRQNIIKVLEGIRDRAITQICSLQSFYNLAKLQTVVGSLEKKGWNYFFLRENWLKLDQDWNALNVFYPTMLFQQCRSTISRKIKGFKYFRRIIQELITCFRQSLREIKQIWQYTGEYSFNITNLQPFFKQVSLFLDSNDTYLSDLKVTVAQKTGYTNYNFCCLIEIIQNLIHILFDQWVPRSQQKTKKLSDKYCKLIVSCRKLCSSPEELKLISRLQYVFKCIIIEFNSLCEYDDSAYMEPIHYAMCDSIVPFGEVDDQHIFFSLLQINKDLLAKVFSTATQIEQYEHFLNQNKSYVADWIPSDKWEQVIKMVSAEKWFQLGKGKQQSEQKQECYRKALELNPNNESAYNNLGTLFLKQCRLQEAQQMYQNAIKLNPNRVLYQKNLREALQKAVQ